MTEEGLPDLVQLLQTDGAKVALAHNFLSRSAGLHLGNILALRNHLHGANAPFIPNVGQFVDEAERHTFNLLMSSMALRDLGRRVLKRPLIAASGLPAANAERTKVFTDDVEIALIGELRDHMAHAGLPPLNLVTSWAKDHGTSYTVILVRGPLIRDKKVASDVRSHLEQLDEEAAFAPLIDRYVQIQWAWFVWLQKELGTQFSEELSELDGAIAPWTHSPQKDA